MKKLRNALDRIPRIVRIGIDLLLAAALLLGVYVAVDSPPWGEKAAFRRAEKAAMVGPSILLDRLSMRSDWPDVGYQVLLIGDGGDEILFDSIRILRASRGGRFLSNSLIRREKTDGILLTVPPSRVLPRLSEKSPSAVPLFLFVDDPAAVKATVRLTLSDGEARTLTAARGGENRENEALCSGSGQDGTFSSAVVEEYFLFVFPVTPTEWKSDWQRMMETNSGYSILRDEWPAAIELYDTDNRLIRTVDYTIRTRVGDAHDIDIDRDG